MTHASLGASSAHRWLNCPGSVRMTEGMPDVESEYAIEGTVAHEVLNLALSKRLPADTWAGVELHGVGVTDEMCESVQLCVDAVLAILETDANAQMYLEHKFTLGALNPPAPMFGTADVVIHLPMTRTLVVMDLKYGRGVIVEAENNPQLLYYTLGALLDLEREKTLRGMISHARAVIMQPRIDHPEGLIREAVYDYEDVVAFAGDLLERAAATLAADAPLAPGDWCQFCKAAGVCPALKERATAVAMVEFEALPEARPPAPETLPVEVLSDILSKAGILEDWLAAVRSFITGKLERGEQVPGWKLIDKRANRRWAAESATLAWLLEHGVNTNECMTAPELKSVAQVEKITKSVGLGKIPADLVTQVSSGTKLAPDTDPRPAALLGPAVDFADNLVEPEKS
jgi:hypothetical protein